MLKKSFISVACVLLSAGLAFGAGNFSYTPTTTSPSYNAENYPNQAQYPSNGTLKGSVVTVPAGQSVSAIVTTPLNSAVLELGQGVTLALGSDFYYNNKLIAPAGSSVSGSVIEVGKAKHGSINGKLLIRFTQIVTPTGVQIPISAVIKTNDNSGLLVGGTKMDVTKEYAKDVVGGSAVGAVSGVVFGALAGGNVGRGAALGTAVGAGSGLVKSAWDKGNDVVIPANAQIDIVLTQPITVNPAIYSSNY